MSGQRRALVIAHEPLGGGGLVGERLRERGYEVHEHVVTDDLARPNDPAAFPDESDYDLLVPMGSVRSLTDTGQIDSWIFTEMDIIRRAHTRRTPMLGVCFGGQLLSAALGGSVEQAPEPEIGWYEVQAPPGAVNPAGPGPWFQWHHDRFTPPPEAEVLAVNDNAVQLFRLGRSVGTQFHPEVTVTHMHGFLSGATEDYLDHYDVDPEQMLDEMRTHEARNSEQCTTLIDWFLDEVVDSKDYNPET